MCGPSMVNLRVLTFLMPNATLENNTYVFSSATSRRRDKNESKSAMQNISCAKMYLYYTSWLIKINIIFTLQSKMVEKAEVAFTKNMHELVSYT